MRPNEGFQRHDETHGKEQSVIRNEDAVMPGTGLACDNNDKSYSPGSSNVHPSYIESQKWLSWQRPLVAGYRQYLHFVGRPLKPPP